MKYVATKISKSLETNKLRGGFKYPPKNLLLPISFGVSSISLLHALDQQLLGRASQNRHAGYTLHVLFVDQSTVLEQAPLFEKLELLKQAYPYHQYSVRRLEEYVHYGISVDGIAYDVALPAEDRVGDGAQRIKHVLSNLSSATSKADMIDILRRRFIFAFAKANNCDSVLFGDTTTRLAEKTLSETSKGRGSALSWLTADRPSSDDTSCVFPLRDLLRKELSAYASMSSPALTPLISGSPIRKSTSSKDTTIDSLMTQYFESVEQNFPSIVANVVKTTSKLVTPRISDDVPSCLMCTAPIMHEHWGGEQKSLVPSDYAESRRTADSKTLCYGCSQTVPESCKF